MPPKKSTAAATTAVATEKSAGAKRSRSAAAEKKDTEVAAAAVEVKEKKTTKKGGARVEDSKDENAAPAVVAATASKNKDTSVEAILKAVTSTGATTGPNKALLLAIQRLMLLEHRFGSKFAALSHLRLVGILARDWADTKIAASKDIPHGGGSESGLGRAGRLLIDEFLTSGTIARADELAAANTDIDPTAPPLDAATLAAIEAAEVVGTPLSVGQQKAIAEAAKQYAGMSVDNLKAVLRANVQLLSGAKAELIAKCAQGHVLGALGSCPECHGGRLRFDADTGVYWCHGYMDDTDYIPCYYRGNTATRGQWNSV